MFATVGPFLLARIHQSNTVDFNMSESTPNPAELRESVWLVIAPVWQVSEGRSALDRASLAGIRTTLTMASFGFALAAFFRAPHQTNPGEKTLRPHEGAILFGVALIVLGLVATPPAGAADWFTLRRLRRGEIPVLRQWPLSITVAMLFSALCLVGFWALFM